MADDMHPYQVKTFLSAEEFTALKAIADAEGLAQSGYIRRLIKRAITDHCAEQLNKTEVPERASFSTDDPYARPYTFTFADR